MVSEEKAANPYILGELWSLYQVWREFSHIRITERIGLAVESV
jgi:hypothetical protein